MPVSAIGKRWSSVILGLGVSGVALWYLFHRDLSGVRDELLGARYVAVLPCVVLIVVGLGLRALRWRVLLGERLSARHSFHILNVSYFVNGVLPLRVGELARAALAARLDPPVPVFTALSTIVVERLLDTMAVFALIGLTLAILPTGLEIGVMGAALGVGTIIGVVVLLAVAARPRWAHTLLNTLACVLPPLRSERLHAWLDHALDGITPLANPRTAALAFGWTALAWATSVMAGYVLLYAIFETPTWAASLAMVALASFAIAVPAVPGNLGPFEAAIVFALASTGLVAHPTDPPAVAFALLLHAEGLMVYIVLGLIGLWAEGVSLGELVSATRKLRGNSSATLQPPAQSVTLEARGGDNE